MALALPTQTFADVQKYMRQKRAVGQQVTPTEEKSAWQAYWDVMAARQGEAERIGLEHERIGLSKEQLEINKEQMKRSQRAATIQGVGQIAGTMAMGAHVLKGTKIGGKIGLGTSGVDAGTVPSIAPTTGQVSAMGAGYGPVTAEFAASQGFGAVAPAAGETVATTGATTSAATGMSTSLASGASTMGVGLVGTGIGMGAKALIPGDKPVVEGAAGAAGGAMAGAAIGSVVPVVGTAVGAVVGGIAGLMGGGK